VSALLELAERCEKASGPNRGLDWMIQLRDGPNGVGAYGPHPHFTASIDAAMALVPGDAFWRLGHDGDGADPSEFRADVIVPRLGGADPRGRAIGSTPALALCAAALRARAAGDVQ
jgi:hypothetical protein